MHVVAEVDTNGVLQKSYNWGPGVDNLLSYTTGYGTGTTNTYYPMIDHLGTIHAVADQSGSIVESYRYDACGRVLGVYNGNGSPLNNSAIGNNYLWHGRCYSWPTRFYYFRARWYDPVTGRWLSKDPIGINGGLNQYVAFENNAVNFIDPEGQGAWYGNYGGPSYSAGQKKSFEFCTAKEIAANPPIDSLDALFEQHDKDFADARRKRDAVLKSPRSTWKQKRAAKKQYKKDKRTTNDWLDKEIKKLEKIHPSKWPMPAPSSIKARHMCTGATMVFW